MQDKAQGQAKPTPRRYVRTELSGEAIGFYSSDVHAVIPAGAIAITEDQYKQFHEGQRAQPQQRYRFSGGTMVPHDPAPTLAQRALVAIQTGLTVTLSSGPAITFPTNRAARQRAGDGVGAIAATGTTTYPMRDAAGTWHVLTAAQYRAVAGAIVAYAAACELIAEGNPLGATDLPSVIFDART